MSFQVYMPKPQGMRGLDGGISLNKTQISLGRIKPPFEYALLEYDIDNCAIRLSAGTKDNGIRVVRASKGNYVLNASNFINKGWFPLGRYSRGDTKDTNWTFTKAKGGEPSRAASSDAS